MRFLSNAAVLNTLQEKDLYEVLCVWSQGYVMFWMLVPANLTRESFLCEDDQKDYAS